MTAALLPTATGSADGEDEKSLVLLGQLEKMADEVRELWRRVMESALAGEAFSFSNTSARPSKDSVSGLFQSLFQPWWLG